MRVVPVLLGMARHLAVGRLSIEHCAFHNACNDVFTNRSCCICRWGCGGVCPRLESAVGVRARQMWSGTAMVLEIQV